MLQLYKHRSYIRCISEGYGFLAANLWTTTKAMAPYFLLQSVVMVLSNAVNTHANVAFIAGQEIKPEEAIASVALYTLMFATYFFSLYKLYRFYKKTFGHKPHKNEEKTNDQTDETEAADITKQSSPKKSLYIKKVAKAFFRHLGKIIGTALLSLFIFVVLSIMAYLPVATATYAYFANVEGQINFGDTTTIPLSGYTLIFLTGTLCFTIINMISVGFYTSLLLLYGDIKKQDS